MQNRFAATVRPYLPGIREVLFASFILLMFFFASHVSAQTVDSVAGTNVTTKGCNFVKSIDNAVLLKILCMAIAGFGIIKYLPTRKDGLGYVATGVIGFLVLSKFTTIMGVFGMSC